MLDRVPINYDGWDTHTRNFPILRETNLPDFDRVYAALLEDLQEDVLLDETDHGIEFGTSRTYCQKATEQGECN